MRDAGSPVMCAMKWQGPLERQMEVDRAGQKRKNTQREAHKETEKIEIRPGHKSPRARHLLSATCRCGARAGIRDTDLVACARPPRPARLNCEVQKRAADGRCPFVLHSDDCRGAKPLRDAPLSPASGEFPPAAKSPGESLHVRQ